MKNLEITICSNCILPDTFPGISFNDKGECIHCQRFKGHTATEAQREKYENKFLALIEKTPRNGAYDVIVAYSGGKDSTYTLDLFVNRYKLRVLALTFDNTFISPVAVENIAKICGNLDVDNVFVRPAPKTLRKIFSTASKKELYTPKTLERASTICTSCISFVKGIILRTALEKAIPFIGYGWSPGQAPIQSSVMRTNPQLMKSAQKATLAPLLEIAGETILPHFVSEAQFESQKHFPWNIHPLAFLDYNEEKIIRRNNEIGWIKPDDTDPNSTNCLLNAYANQVHRNRYNFHPYVWEIANMVRQGVLERAEGMEKIYSPENKTIVDYAKRELATEEV